jgi:hypothetical protein
MLLPYKWCQLVQFTELSIFSIKNETYFYINMYFTGNYLRVLTPRTTDGNTPLLIGGQQQYKETALPFTARKRLDARNRQLPSHLRHIIEEVTNHQAQQSDLQVSGPVGVVEKKGKPGPKLKAKA